VAEHVEPWSYIKFNYLKPLGWKGFEEGAGSGIYSVAPLARLNVSDGMATPKAQKAYDELFATLGGKPVHHTLANHWARVVEMIQAGERMVELINDPGIVGKDIRVIPHEMHLGIGAVPAEPTTKIGIGVVEAPRGTLFHHFEADHSGIITKVNLIVATQNNAARIAMSVEKAAKGLIKNGEVTEGLLNMVEMAFRAYDPCLGCATHSLPGHMPLSLTIYDHQRQVLRHLVQD
jgi:F420-non-reducing hydrogenase large subunit